MKKAAIGRTMLIVLSGALLWGSSDVRSRPTTGGRLRDLPPKLSPAATVTAPTATDSSDDCSRNPPSSVTDEALIDAIRAGALHSERCRALLDAELLVRVLRLGCEIADFPRGPGPCGVMRGSVAADLGSARCANGGPAGSLEASTLRCVMRSLATAPPALARTLGVWLATRLQGRRPGHVERAVERTGTGAAGGSSSSRRRMVA